MEAHKLQLHDAYRVLGLPAGATLNEVKQAYRRLALRHHPDRPGGDAKSFERLERAYNDLCAAVGVTRGFSWEPEEPTLGLNEIHQLGRELRESEDPHKRLFACRTLANSGKRSAYAYIREALYDPSQLVVISAVEAVGALGIRQAYGDLGALYTRGSDAVRRAVLGAIERSSVIDRFRSVVLQALEDSDAEVRRRGLSCFARMRGKKVG